MSDAPRVVRPGLPPYVIFPQAILRDSSLSDKAMRLWGVLGTFADNETHTSYPKMSTLLALTGWSRSTLFRTIEELTDHGYLEVISGKNAGTANVYVLLEPGVSDGGDTGVRPEEHRGIPPAKHKGTTPIGTTPNQLPIPGVSDLEPVDNGTPVRATDDPVKASAHALAVFAMEQPVKPVIAKLPNAFPAVMRMIETELRAGRPEDDIRAVIEAGVDVWTTQGLRTSLAKARPPRNPLYRGGSIKRLVEEAQAAEDAEKRAIDAEVKAFYGELPGQGTSQ